MSEQERGRHGTRATRRTWVASRTRVAPQKSRLGLRVIGGCAVGPLVAVLTLLVTSHQGHLTPSTSAERLHLQKQVVTVFAGIPQHGAVLGQPTAPVTLQVFVDLEDHGDGTRWFDAMLPPILARFVRTNIVRLEFHSFKTDTLNRRPFLAQQVAALAAGAQNLLWNYATIFVNEQGREFTNYVTEKFLKGIAEQIPGLNLTEWEQSRNIAMAKSVVADNNTAFKAGFHDTPAFRIGLTGGRMKNFVGRHTEVYHKYIVRKTSSGERYIAGQSPKWQHPVSLIDAIDLKKAVEKLV